MRPVKFNYKIAAAAIAGSFALGSALKNIVTPDKEASDSTASINSIRDEIEARNVDDFDLLG